MEPTFHELVHANIRRIMRECADSRQPRIDLPEYEVHLHTRHMDWVLHVYPANDGATPNTKQYGASIQLGNVQTVDSSICWPIMLQIYDHVRINYSELLGFSIQQIVDKFPDWKITIKCESAFKTYMLERAELLAAAKHGVQEAIMKYLYGGGRMNILRYKGYTITVTQWGGMYRAVVSLLEGGTKSTEYCLSYGAAVSAAERIVDAAESQPPATFGSGK